MAAIAFTDPGPEPMVNSRRSGGKRRVLGDWPRRIILPDGSFTPALRSAVIRMTNFSRSIVGSVVRPLPISPSLITRLMDGNAAQAT